MIPAFTMRVWSVVATLCATTLVGCATYQGPRIDPTGERIFAWPDQAPAAAVATPPGVVISPGGAVATSAAATPVQFGNVQAPPVFSDPATPTIPAVAPGAVIPQVPFAPATAIPGTVAATCPVSTVTPSVPVVTPLPGTQPAATVPPGCSFVKLTPDRLVAPVGTEVFLKAGVMMPDGSLSAFERIEWSVSRSGVGQVGSLGVQEPVHLLSWWNEPEKIDPWTAVGRTAYYPTSVTSATPGPFGSAQIERGETYITLLSCTEGVSQVAAVAPDLSQFNQATASIYWIDAQWTTPAAAVAEAGKSHTLTTTIFRRTNGAPLVGWVVRYTVGGGGSLGPENSSTIDARTDASGRATAEISPSQMGSGISQVGITIIHPHAIGPNALPQVELARSATSITWSTNAPIASPAAPVAPTMAPAPVGVVPLGPPPSSATPPVSVPSPTLQPTPKSPPAASSTQPNTYTPPPAGRPRLEVTLRPTSPEQVSVGQYVSYELTITNRGDGVARGIKVAARFDQGLSHIGDTRKEHHIENSNIRELAPNDTERVPLTYQVVASGKQCHQVTVTADGAEPVQRQACVTGAQASLTVKVSGEHTRVVGDTTTFLVSVQNTGSTTASNVELRVLFDPAIDPILEPGMERVQDGSILVRLNGDLALGEKRSLRLQGRCRTQSTHACARASVSSMGSSASQDEDCLEILPLNPASTPGTGQR